MRKRERKGVKKAELRKREGKAKKNRRKQTRRSKRKQKKKNIQEKERDWNSDHQTQKDTAKQKTSLAIDIVTPDKAPPSKKTRFADSDEETQESKKSAQSSKNSKATKSDTPKMALTAPTPTSNDRKHTSPR